MSEIEALRRKCLAVAADVRVLQQVAQAVDKTVVEFGKIINAFCPGVQGKRI